MSAPPYTQPEVVYQPPPAGYPHTGVGYPPPPQNPEYPPPNAGYPPPNASYPPPNAGYPAPGTGYPPPSGTNYPQPPNAGYVQPSPGYGQPGYPQTGGAPMAAPGSWMPVPATPVNCPPGLEYLTMIDQLLVHQQVELLEAFIGFESANKYEVKNSLGQKVYFAAEDNDCLTRNCCGPMRPFEMKILNNFGNEVLHLYRPLRCDSCWFPCCLQKMEVSSPPGTIIGYVTQEWSILIPKFRIENAAGDTVLCIEGPFCTFNICGDVEFKVLSHDGSTEVGKISKQWTGFVKETFTDTDNFGISFPMDLDVKIKAVLLGACFLIDFMFFEKSGNKEQDSPGMF